MCVYRRERRRRVLEANGKFDFGAKRYLNREPMSKKHQLTNPDPPPRSSSVLLSAKIESDVKNYCIRLQSTSSHSLPTTSIQKSLSPFVGGKYFQGYLCCLNKTEKTTRPKTNSQWFMGTVNYLNELTDKLNAYGKLHTPLRNVNAFLNFFLIVQTRFETCNDNGNNTWRLNEIVFLQSIDHNQTW